MIKKKWQLAGR